MAALLYSKQFRFVKIEHSFESPQQSKVELYSVGCNSSTRQSVQLEGSDVADIRTAEVSFALSGEPQFAVRRRFDGEHSDGSTAGPRAEQLFVPPCAATTRQYLDVVRAPACRRQQTTQHQVSPGPPSEPAGAQRAGIQVQRQEKRAHPLPMDGHFPPGDDQSDGRPGMIFETFIRNCWNK